VSHKGHRVLPLVLAAAAEDQDQSDDDDPERVIVKKIAKTVIHDKSSILSLSEVLPSTIT
jgi:hypothetical protein